MAGYQKIIIEGNLGRDPEQKTTTTGTDVSNFSVAVSEKYKDQESTEWFSCVAFGKTAEICNRYLQKGRPVLIEGRMKTRSWDGRDGEKRKTTELIIDRVVLLGSRSDSNERLQPEHPSYSEHEPDPAAEATQESFDDTGITDSDIPF